MNNLDLSDFKTPPNSIEAEQSVLGGLLLDNDAYFKIGDVIRQADFYRHDHALIYEHISSLIEKSKPVDIVTLAESLESRSELSSVGGIAYLGSLVQNTPSSANIGRYAEIVRERSVLRKLIETSSGITENAFNPQGKTVDELLDEAEAKIFKIAESKNHNNEGFIDVKTVLPDIINEIDELYSRENITDVTGVSTGYKDLNTKTSGFQRGDLIIIAGRPSMGKTAFSLNIAENVAIESGLPVAVFSMEMSAKQLGIRMISSIGRINQSKMRNGNLEDDDWPRLTAALGKLDSAPIYIDESAGLTSFEVRQRARRLQRQVGELGLIVIDYLQLMSGSTLRPGENRATELSEISRSLKALAKELNVPVVALSQLNRSLEQRQDKRPVMSDLRESGAIEQDADLILFIYRDEVYNEDSMDKGTAEIIISKQRNGPIGKVRMTFIGENTRFEDHAYGHIEE
jgi:replicative DNA helicase